MRRWILWVLSLLVVCSSLAGMGITAGAVMQDEEAVYDFGEEYILVKDFNTSALAETEIGDTGFKVSTATSNWNNVVVRENASTNSGYYPYGSDLPDNGYYLFIGSGGNSSVNATLTLPNSVTAGKYIKLTYAKPLGTNNGSSKRGEANNANTFTVGTEVVDLQNNCEFNQWYTTTIKADSDISTVAIHLGKWSSIAISKIEVVNSADTMELTCGESEKYITSENVTVQYAAIVYNSVTALMGSEEIVSKGTAGTSAQINYSVNGYEGVSIDNTGLLTITPQAQPGIVTVSAECGGVTKTLELELLEIGDADAVIICGEELVEKGSTLQLKAIPTAEGAIIPERATEWSIEGDNHGCSIENGLLTVPENAQSGNITVKAKLTVIAEQLTANVSNTFTVTIKDDAVVSPYEVRGIFLKNCASDLQASGGIDGVIVDADSTETGYSLVVKAVDENGLTIAEKVMAMDGLKIGVQEMKTAMSFENAVQVKAYIVDSDNVIVSKELCKTDKGEYKNVPLVSDWITGAKSGLGMGAGIIAPQGAPYGVDPELVDVSALNVKYTYDDNYQLPSTDNALWYKTGAYLASANGANNSIYARDGADWEQKALPIGNGYMGGMLFGLPDKDQIQINEETFWAAGYRGVQESVDSNSINNNMSEGINGFMSVGNIFVDFNMPENATVNNYYRDLNLDEAVAHVSYEYDGVKYGREYFASYPKEVLVFRYTADTDGALNFDVKPVSMHPGEVTVNDGEITIIGKLKDSEPYSSGGNAAWNQESDLEYCTKIRVIADDGTVTDGYNTVNVSGATGVTVIVTAATDYDPDQFELNEDGTVNMDKTPYKSVLGVWAAIEKATARMNGAAAMSYADLKAEHIADYKAQFDTVKFSLTDDAEICDIPTDELQASYNSVVGTQTNADGTTTVSYADAAYENLNKHLEELHFNYARYLMISSSRSTTMPATLQGKWCQSVAEIWGSCYCININMEMNYWFAGGANLYTNMKVTTTDTKTYPDGYYYTTWEGRSPEQGPTHTGIKYDLQLVAGMYDYVIAAAEILDVDADKVAAWKEIRNHLEIPVELGDDGQIKEWAEETTYNTDADGNALGDPVHRHISHLVGLYPGTLINRETPELLEGAKVVLENRGDDSTGWSCSNKFLLWARALEGDKALELFRYQLAKKTYSNLFDTHAPFQIDGNFGSAAGVMELLMQSQTGEIYILPALPTVWDKGEISGIKAKNGEEVSIKWTDGKATEIKIVPAVDGDVTIGYEKENGAFMLGDLYVEFGTDGLYTIKNAKADEEYILTTTDVRTDVSVTEVTLNQTELTLRVGEIAALAAALEPESAVDKTLTWSSDAEGVATVEDGVVTAVAEGNATITVTTANGRTAVCTVTVEAIEEADKIVITDIDEKHWGYSFVTAIAEQKIMNGVHTNEDGSIEFAPDAALSREMVAQILYNAEGTPEATAENRFTDVVEDAWYEEAVIWAAEKGIVSGYLDGTFGVGKKITRQEIATMLCNYAKYKEYDTTAAGDLSTFADVADVADWATNNMSWAVGNGIITGKAGNLLDPKGNATRAEAATMIYKFNSAF